MACIALKAPVCAHICQEGVTSAEGDGGEEAGGTTVVVDRLADMALKGCAAHLYRTA